MIRHYLDQEDLIRSYLFQCLINRTRHRILDIHSKDKPIGPDVDLAKVAELTENFSGADASSVANTAVSLVLHEYLAKYPTPEEGS